MRIRVNLNKCQNHGQCAYAAPRLFALDEKGKLSFRHESRGSYLSGDLEDGLRAEAEEAADLCPLQAIDIVE